jgi:hypothetical protein
LLTGDYPLTEFTTAGRIVCFFMCLFAVGVVAIPAGIFASGFVAIVNRERKAARKLALQQAKAYRREQKQADRLNAPTTQQLQSVPTQAIRLKERGEEKFITKKSTADLRIKVRATTVFHSDDQAICKSCLQLAIDEQHFRYRLYKFLNGDTVAGDVFEKFVMIVIFGNVISFVLSTDAQFDGNDTAQRAFDWIEAVSVGIFTVEYVLRLYASADDPNFPNRFRWCISFLALVDLFAIVPFYVDLCVPGHIVNTSVLRSVRLVRLFKAEHYTEAFTMFDNVIERNQTLLMTSGFLGIMIWVVAATLLYYTERNNASVEGAFSSIPNAMFYTILFLGGEWAKADLTTLGRLVGFVLCIVGIAVFAVPVGILGAGFQELLEELKDFKKLFAGKLIHCKECNILIKDIPEFDDMM